MLNDHASDPATRHFHDADELRRFQKWRRILCRSEISVCRLAERAGLQHCEAAVRAALAEDPRFAPVTKNGPRRFRLIPEHRRAFLRAHHEDHDDNDDAEGAALA